MGDIHWSRRSGFPLRVVAVAVLTFCSIGLGGGATPDRSSSYPDPTPAATVEPLPGLALDLSVSAVEQTASGGIASLPLETTSTGQVEILSLVVRLPPHVIFTDGAQEKRWDVALAAGERASFPIDLLIERPGRFHIAAEAIGTVDGKTIHRGTACPLDVGRVVMRPEVINGAIQYRGRSRGRGGSR